MPYAQLPLYPLTGQLNSRCRIPIQGFRRYGIKWWVELIEEPWFSTVHIVQSNNNNNNNRETNLLMITKWLFVF